MMLHEEWQTNARRETTHQEGNGYATSDGRLVEHGRLIAQRRRRLPSPDVQQHAVAFDMDGEV